MTIHSAIAKFLHRAKTDATSTETELKKVLDAVTPEITGLKNAVVDELQDELAEVGTDIKGAIAIATHDHALTLDAAITALEKDIFARFDALDAKVEAARTEFAKRTPQVKKAAPAAAKAAPAAAAAPAAPAKTTPAK
jgi:hypothetical protein